MKKIRLILLLCACCTFSFAEDVRDSWFNILAEATQKHLPQGASLRRDAAHRILFLDMPLPLDSSRGFNVEAAHKAMVDALKKTPDAEFVKKADILLIYNYVTTDQKVFSVVISKEDL